METDYRYFLTFLKHIKKMKASELEKLSKRFDIIDHRPDSLFGKYFSEAMMCCDFHFEGGNTYQENCPCACFCKNCEYSAQDDVGKRMQEIGEDIGEENVILELINKGYAEIISEKDIDGKS